MKWAFLSVFLSVKLISFGQSADTTKPVLAFGPWFKKRMDLTQPVVVVPMDSIKASIYMKSAAQVRQLADGLDTASVESWRTFINQYQELVNGMKGDRSVEPYLISDSLITAVIMHASRNRMPRIANTFIQESRRIHPNGAYRVYLNCKHE